MSKGIYKRWGHGPRFKDITGKRFGTLLVVEYSRSDPKEGIYWKCQCDCGSIVEKLAGRLRCGRTTTCGDRERHAPKNNQSKQLEYSCWKAMINRCTNPACSNYFLYGGRGIKVCDAWLTDFWKFKEDVGNRPDKTYSLDRKNVNGNYEPDNVKWATPIEQGNNRRVQPKRLNFSEYQNRASMTAIYPAKGEFLGLVYCSLGLVGEAGEIAGKVKKLYRDTQGEVSAESRKEIGKEVGDCVWYLSQLCAELDIDFSHIALENLEKLKSRSERGVLKGSGDNR